MIDATGEKVGAVRFERRGKSRALRVSVSVRKLSPGFHGFHVHTVGRCEGPAFMTAGAHLSVAGAGHPAHAGDMPPLLVTSGGKAEARFTTDRFSLADLRDADGSAVVVHALPDNQAHIPTDRYDPDADATTLATGHSGARIACGEVLVQRGPADASLFGDLRRGEDQRVGLLPPGSGPRPHGRHLADRPPRTLAHQVLRRGGGPAD